MFFFFFFFWRIFQVIFFQMGGGGHEKAGVTEFFNEKLGGHKNDLEMIGWLQIYWKFRSVKKK